MASLKSPIVGSASFEPPIVRSAIWIDSRGAIADSSTRPPIADRRSKRLDLLVDLVECVADVLAAALMRRRSELAFEVGPRESQRFQLAQSRKVHRGRRLLFRPRLGQLVHPLLNPRLDVNQSFSGITHGMSGLLLSANGY
jgi:hypothetical protein